MNIVATNLLERKKVINDDDLLQTLSDYSSILLTHVADLKIYINL
jgi:hypothetical protein